MTDIQQQIVTIIRKNSSMPDMQNEELFKESFLSLGIDSLDYLKIITEIEDALDISFEGLLDSFHKKTKIFDFIESVVKKCENRLS